MPDQGTCRSCHAPVLWVVMGKTLKKNPLNPEVVTIPDDKPEQALIRINAEGQGITERSRKGYVSHFATCPAGRSHRKK